MIKKLVLSLSSSMLKTVVPHNIFLWKLCTFFDYLEFLKEQLLYEIWSMSNHSFCWYLQCWVILVLERGSFFVFFRRESSQRRRTGALLQWKKVRFISPIKSLLCCKWFILHNATYRVEMSALHNINWFQFIILNLIYFDVKICSLIIILVVYGQVMESVTMKREAAVRGSQFPRRTAAHHRLRFQRHAARESALIQLKKITENGLIHLN